MDFNIDRIEAATRKTFDVIVGHRPGPAAEDGKPTLGEKVGFVVLGPNSEEYQQVLRAIELMNVKEAAERDKAEPGAAVDISTDAGAALIVDGETVRNRMIVSACLVGWFGFTVGDGDVPADFTPANVDRVFAAWPRWRNRVAAAIRDEANFI